MSVIPSSQAAAAVDPPGRGADVLDSRRGKGDAPRVIDFANADVEMNQASRLAREVNRWLDWQCRMISGVRRGAVFLLPKVPGGALERAAMWPDPGLRSNHLRTVAARAIGGADGVTQKEVVDERDGAEVCDYVAYPLLRNGRVVGAVGLALAIRSESQQQAVLQLLQWGTLWLEEAIARTDEEGQLSSALALEAVGRLGGPEPLAVSAHHLCNLLAEALGCSLVAYGHTRGMQVRVNALSHQLRFDHRARRVAQITFAMEEAADRRTRVVLPAPPGQGSSISQAHSQLLADTGSGAVCSVPLFAGDRIVGVLTLLRDGDRPFEGGSLELLDAVAEQVGPLVLLKQQARTGWEGVAHLLSEPWRRLLGRGHLRLKLAVAGLLLATLGLLTIQTDHRVSARSHVEGRLQQAVVAPFAGYLSETGVRAGDRVTEGQLLAALDRRDLLLEQEKLVGEREKYRKEYQQALADGDRAKVTMARARIDQAEAQVGLVEDQLERAQLLAPFAGLVVSGDWQRALGAPLERGQVLFEIVPDEDFRIILQVDEHDVSRLQPGQRGRLRLTGMPGDPLAFEVARLFPVATAADGGNHFRVEAALDDMPPGLRPGMQGVAKVTVGRDSLFNVWTAPLRSRLRLWAWSLGL